MSKKNNMPKTTVINYGVLDTSIGYLLRRSQLTAFKSFSHHFRDFDIKPAQFSALEIIANNPGLGQSRLAESLGLQRTNLVGMLDMFQARGLIERQASTTDKRSHLLFLTEQGKVLLTNLHHQFQTHEAELTNSI